jgi:hypothetical protein
MKYKINEKGIKGFIVKYKMDLDLIQRRIKDDFN